MKRNQRYIDEVNAIKASLLSVNMPKELINIILGYHALSAALNIAPREDMKFQKLINEIKSLLLIKNFPQALIGIVFGYYFYSINTRPELLSPAVKLDIKDTNEENDLINDYADNLVWDFFERTMLYVTTDFFECIKFDKEKSNYLVNVGILNLNKYSIDHLSPRQQEKIIEKIKTLGAADIGRMFVSRIIMPEVAKEVLTPHYGRNYAPNALYNANTSLFTEILEFLKLQVVPGSSEVLSLKTRPFKVNLHRETLSGKNILLPPAQAEFKKQSVVPLEFKTANKILHALYKGELGIKSYVADENSTPLIHLALKCEGTLREKLALLGFILAESPASINDQNFEKNTLMHITQNPEMAEILLLEGVEIINNRAGQKPAFSELIEHYEKNGIPSFELTKPSLDSADSIILPTPALPSGPVKLSPQDKDSSFAKLNVAPVNSTDPILYTISRQSDEFKVKVITGNEGASLTHPQSNKLKINVNTLDPVASFSSQLFFLPEVKLPSSGNAYEWRQIYSKDVRRLCLAAAYRGREDDIKGLNNKGNEPVLLLKLLEIHDITLPNRNSWAWDRCENVCCLLLLDNESFNRLIKIDFITIIETFIKNLPDTRSLTNFIYSILNSRTNLSETQRINALELLKFIKNISITEDHTLSLRDLDNLSLQINSWKTNKNLVPSEREAIQFLKLLNDLSQVILIHQAVSPASQPHPKG